MRRWFGEKIGSILQTFKLNPIYGTVYLITRQVLFFFASGDRVAATKVHFQLMAAWILMNEEVSERKAYGPYDSPRVLDEEPLKRKWLENSDDDNIRYSMKRARNDMNVLDKYMQRWEKKNRTLRAISPEGEYRKYSEWATMARNICEQLQMRAWAQARATEWVRDPAQRKRLIDDIYPMVTLEEAVSRKRTHEELLLKLSGKLLNARKDSEHDAGPIKKYRHGGSYGGGGIYGHSGRCGHSGSYGH